MLRRLTIRNLAIVEDLDVDLGPGLTVITGETGAGKSILVDALSLLSGSRGSASLVRDGAPRLLVSGEFDADPESRSLLAEAGLPEAETFLIRRELSADGRSRVFVEDEPASVRTLARLGERLIAIHGQNSEQELEDPAAPLELLDAFAGARSEREHTAMAASRWKQAQEVLENLETSRRDRTARLETLDYQIREVEGLAALPGEEEDLAAERDRLRHADRIRRAGEIAWNALSEADVSAADRLGEAVRAFTDLAAIDPREREHLLEAEALKGRIADLAAAARRAALETEADPDRLTGIETRLEKIVRLQRRYRASGSELSALLERWKGERADLSSLEDALDQGQREAVAAREGYRKAASLLSARRRSCAAKFSAAVQKELSSLAMEKARFSVALEDAAGETPRASGGERAAFLFAPNPGEPEKRLERIASGGELSRLQLAIRSVAGVRKGRGRTLVFDEVDAGIGGRTAEVVGRKLRQLASGDQVLCVTHVPQIAALADRHFLAEKGEINGRTVATLRLLEEKDRVTEVARMLAGEKVPETAVKHARSLLAAGRAG